MARYLDQTGLQDYTTQLTAKYKTVFATKSEVGTPLVASTAAAMTDTTKVYVYVGSETSYTSGNWYYYNGSAWVSGGVYNSTALQTDTTLSVAGMAADAKSAGDAVAATNKSVSFLANSVALVTMPVQTVRIWAQGSISQTNGSDSTSNNRIRTSNYFMLTEPKLTVSVPAGYKFGVRIYGSNTASSFIEAQGFFEGEQTFNVTVGNYVRFILAYTNDANISTSEGNASFSATFDRPRLAQLTYKLPFYCGQFIGKSARGSTGSVGNYDYAAFELHDFRFGVSGAVYFSVSDSNIAFRIYDRTNESFVTNGFVSEWYLEVSDTTYGIEIITVDHSDIEISDVQSLVAMTSKDNYDFYMNYAFQKIEHTNRFWNYGYDPIYRYGMYDSGSLAGFAQRGQNYYRITSKPQVSDKDVTIYVGHGGVTTNTVQISDNSGNIVTLPEGSRYKIPAGTIYTVAFKSNSTSADNDIAIGSFMVIEDSEPELILEDGTHSSYDYASVYMNDDVASHVQTACLVGDKIFTVGSDGIMKYSVYDLSVGQYIVDGAAIDHSPGHANSGNFDNGNFYVSDWTDNTLIHVYALDYDNNTLTYSRDIVLPESNYGRMGYYVQNNEREIFFLGWATGNNQTTYNTMVYGLYVWDGEKYILSYARHAIRCEVLQSFTKQDRYLYYVEVTFSPNYKTNHIGRIDLLTGETKLYGARSTITNYEAESIMPIGNKTFLINDSTGRLFFYVVED